MGRNRGRVDVRALVVTAVCLGVLLCGVTSAAAATAPIIGSGVYWTNFSPATIGHANLDGSAVNQDLVSLPPAAGGEADASAVAQDGHYLYVGNEWGPISRVNFDGTGLTPFTSDNDPFDLAVGGSYLYIANGGGTIDRVPIDDPSSALSPVLTGPYTNIISLAVDSQYVYWTNYDTDSIGRANLDGSDANQSFITGLTEPDAIAVDGSHIYWATFESSVGSSPGSIGRANLDGTDPDASFITSGVDTPEGLAVDAGHVYWASRVDGTIGRANLDGSDVNDSFISGGQDPEQIAVAPGPSIAGTLASGQSLTVGSTGTFGGDPGTFTEAWYSCDASGQNCATTASGTGSAYTPTESDVGRTVELVVTDTNASGAASESVVSGVIAQGVAPTKLVAKTVLASLLRGGLTVTLTRSDTGAPLAGQTIVFVAGGRTICQATTGTNGVARCVGIAPLLAAWLNRGYTASYAGSAAYAPATATAKLT